MMFYLSELLLAACGHRDVVGDTEPGPECAVSTGVNSPPTSHLSAPAPAPGADGVRGGPGNKIMNTTTVNQLYFEIK